jgi:uncharacterized protein
VPSFLGPLIRSPQAVFALWNQRTGAPVVTHLQPAFDSRTRNRGLLGRTALDTGHALVLAPCSAVHTFFMSFAIDVLFVDRNGRVLHVVPALRPWRVAARFRSFAVIEMAAGVAGATGTRAGDVVSIEGVHVTRIAP